MLTLILASTLFFGHNDPPPTYESATQGCSYAEQKLGICPDIDNGGDHVQVGGEQELPGSQGETQPQPVDISGGVPGGGGGGTGGTGGPGGVGGAPAEPEECTIDEWNESGHRCILEKPPVESEPEEPQAPVIPAITDREVATFAPPGPALSTEPAGAAIVGMPFNAIAPAQETVAGGSLFGLPVSVVFTPMSYAFDFGDGTVVSATSGGSSWDSLGLPDYAATATSHVYAGRGTFTVVASVSYRAVVDFGPWGVYPVEGLVTVSSSATTVRVVETHTALVESTCIEDPAGPGC